MRILLINQFFWPDSSATSQLLTDLARGLVDRGHEVTAISADSGYAVESADARPHVRMIRIKTLGFRRGRIARLASYASFYLGAAVRALTLPRPDLIVTLTTPPLLPALGALAKILRGSRHFLWEMDMYPDVAIDLNYFKAGGLIHRLTGAVADWSRRHSDGVIALGECMKDRLVARGVDARRIFIADNWADGSAIRPEPRSSGSDDELVVLYSGNLGLAHDLDTIAGAMISLRTDERFRFLFVGSGGRRAELASLVSTNRLNSVEMRPYVERENLGRSLAAGDIGLVTQRVECCGSVVPSKIYGLLAAGRPILFVGPKEATPARIIQRFGCGWQIDCGDVAGLSRLLLHLVANRDEVTRAGQLARVALMEHFDLPIGVERIAGILGAGSVESRSISRTPANQRTFSTTAAETES